MSDSSKSGRPGGQQTVDSIIGTITGHADSPDACAAVVKKAFAELQGQLAEKRVRLVVGATKEYQQWLENYTRQDKPTGVYYKRNDDGSFTPVNTYTEELVKRLATLKENTDKLRAAINECLLEEAKGEAFDKLAAVCKDLHIYTTY